MLRLGSAAPFSPVIPGPSTTADSSPSVPTASSTSALGDGECCDDPQNRAQNMAEPFGKIWRIDVATKAAEIAFYGLRNPWRFSFDRATNDLSSATLAPACGRRSTPFPARSSASSSTSAGTRTRGAPSRRQRSQIPAGPARLPASRLRPPGRPLLDHRRLRLPRSGGTGGARPLLLRRLLHRDDLEPALRERRGDRRPQGGGDGQGSLDVRRGRPRRAIRRLGHHRPGLPARPLETSSRRSRRHRRRSSSWWSTPPAWWRSAAHRRRRPDRGSHLPCSSPCAR